MTFVNRWLASITVYDTAKRSSTVSTYVSEAAAEAWITAADETARDATLVGTFFLAFTAMTLATISHKQVSMLQEEINLAVPADAYRGNKAITSYQSASGVPVRTSIPAYDPALVPLKPNSVEIDVLASSPAAWGAYVDAYEAVAQSNQGSDVQDVLDGYVND